MTKIKTSELADAALDWAVAKIEGINEEAFNLYYTPTESSDLDTHGYPEFHYSTIWAQGGPIIERERILVQPEIGKEGAGNAWSAIAIEGFECFGPTPLIAAMRCYVASKLGDEVDVPDELLP